MKKIIFILLCFSQIVFAQHKKKKVEKIPLKQQIEKYKTPDDQLLNGTLKGSKWYFDMKNYKEGKLYLNKDNTKPDVLNFVDDKKIQININQKNCKSLIRGTYEILKNDGSTTMPMGYHPFKITSLAQKCAENLSGFLSGAVDVFFDENSQVIELTEGENFPPIVPGQ
ncbi:hypothetical protein SAMN05421664_2105 [Chryseobacterium soldanellicola]|uniref:Uncharacterized protein n=1 Tax=Chryseobacterium soldanellicola TaxID=311333 RepID=A0A1H1CUN0_9FLAO|nr:hypothetical protein [Chryseobacterium soldanellicola]SDQ67276.1 hypothetical protein SAMN05421664_2105 [Chryseobacterium soldanellicola]